MKVLVINQHFQDVVGGSEIQCDIIAKKLTEFGHEVIYIAVNSKGNDYNYPYKVIPLASIKVFQLYFLLKKLKYDIIYWRFNKKKLLTTSFIAKVTKSKFIYSISAISDTKIFIDSGESLSHNFRKIFRNHHTLKCLFYLALEVFKAFKNFFIYISVILFADGVVSNNRDHLEKMQCKGFFTCDKIIIPNSVLPVIKKFSWPKPFIVWVSSLKKKKNPELFYKLSQEIENKDMDFLMIGKIQSREYEWINNLKKNENNSNFHYLGQRSPEEVFGIIKESVFLIHTCDPEGFPNNFIQSWILGKPTISLFYDPEGLIEKYNIGHFSKDFKGLIRDTNTLINDESLRLSKGKNALAFADKRFNPDVNVRILEKFMRNLIS